MGRAGQKVLKDEDGLQERVSVGRLARAFPRATVEAVLEASGARGQGGGTGETAERGTSHGPARASKPRRGSARGG